MFPNGISDMNRHHHAPSKLVQFPKVEAMPFLPPEVKAAVRYPVSFAYRRQNKRYEQRVREEV